MNLQNTIKISAIALTVTLLGCAQTPGSRQGDEPPRLVKNTEIIDGKRVDRLFWENPRAFGPVPVRLQNKAALTCRALNSEKLIWRATGYHAKALDLDGKPLVGGGFFCESERQ